MSEVFEQNCIVKWVIFFNILSSANTMVVNFFTKPFYHKKASYRQRCITRAHSSCFMHVIVMRMRTSFFKIFPNFVHFCPNFQIFCPFLSFFILFLKNSKHAYLLSRAGPGYLIFFIGRKMQYCLEKNHGNFRFVTLPLGISDIKKVSPL